MDFFSDALLAAIQLIIAMDPEFTEIVVFSVGVSLVASMLAAATGIPAGIAVAINQFPGKKALQHLLNTLMAMPTVVIGLLLYGLLSRVGPLGEWGLLYTPTAIVIAQSILILPIMMNLTVSAVNSADPRLFSTLRSLGARPAQFAWHVARTTRLAILAGVVTGFGRAIGEVGAAMMLGGNIEGYTRTMTTAIALETSKGEFELALALGLVLLVLAFVLNFMLSWLHRTP